MNAVRSTGFLFLSLGVLIGCSKTPEAPQVNSAKADPVPAKPKEPPVAPAEAKEARIEAALAKLSDTDKVLAQTQKFCPIGKGRLGSMGKPERIELDGQPVFLCCSGCEEDARANPKKTLEMVAELKKGMK